MTQAYRFTLPTKVNGAVYDGGTVFFANTFPAGVLKSLLRTRRAEPCEVLSHDAPEITSETISEPAPVTPKPRKSKKSS